MSSGEDDFNDNDDGGAAEDSRSKKRRVQRACDICRRKKIRCDGGAMPQHRCSNCIAYNFECSYIEAAKKRGPPKGYVESLENRLEKMEKLLQRLCPDADFTQELGGNIDRESWQSELSSNGPPASTSKRRAPLHPASTMRSISEALSADDDLAPSEDERGAVYMNRKLGGGLKELAISPVDKRFHGKSSGLMLIQAAVDFKREYGGPESFHDNHPATRRDEFWKPCHWEFRQEGDPQDPGSFEMPPVELMEGLFEIFFTRINVIHPLLHRPYFEQQYRAGLHITDSYFASVMLLMCACAARLSDDARVLFEPNEPHSAGWKYFEQVEIFQRILISPPRLHHLQIYVLSTLFLAGSSVPHAAWTMVGIGIRMAQDVGAHRNKVYNATPTIQDELWKRAFWILVALDRSMSAALGRPCAIQDEDFDLELPLEIDDDYWDMSAEPCKPLAQPDGKPSTLAFFVCFMKLSQILAFALRTIYSINKSKILLGFVGPQWEQHIVAELDSALNKWIDSVPEHLRWEPERRDPVFFDQSALLYSSYYHLQILIHRPFIPSPKKPSPLSFPSLAICTNAARSCSHVVDIHRHRRSSPMPWIAVPAFTSGIVLLLNIWGVKKTATSPDPVEQMKDVHKCMNVLRMVETRWHAAGRLWDILCSLASMGDFPLPSASPPEASGKRDRDSDSPGSVGSSYQPSPAQSQSALAPRPVAKARRPGRNAQANAPQVVASTNHAFANGLPFNTHELSQLPLHPTYGQYYGHSGFTPPVEPMPWLPDAVGPAAGAFAEPSFAVYEAALGSLAQPQADALFAHGQPGYATAFPDAAAQFKGPVDVHPQAGDLQLETMGMWSTAPPAFEWDDWGNYIQSTSAAPGSQPSA